MNTVLGRSSDKKVVVSLFSGAGGLDLGFEYLGYIIPVAVEIDKQATFTYAQNFGCRVISADSGLKCAELGKSVIINDDIRKVEGKFVLDLCRKISGMEKIDVLLGGPSCQSWSIAGKRLGDKDDRGQMIYEYLRLLRELRPSSFLFENVKGIVSKKFLPVFKDLVSEFEKLGYSVSYKLVNSWDYGVAQTRERVIVVGVCSELGKKYEFPAPLSYKLVLKDVISDLPVPKVYDKKAEENAAYAVPANINNFVGKNHYKKWRDNVLPLALQDTLNKNIGIFLIKNGIPLAVAESKEVSNNVCFDNINLDLTYEMANRSLDMDKPSPTITAHTRCSHILNHQAKDFGYSSRYLSRNRQRQWGEASFTIVGCGRQVPLFPEPANHHFKNYSEEKKKLLAAIPEGSNWRSLPKEQAETYLGGAYNSGGGRTGFLRKLADERPSPTILASMEQKSTEFCIPKGVPRRLTARECMRIQSFPDWFILYGSLSSQYMQVGNAVPVIMAFCLGQKLKTLLN